MTSQRKTLLAFAMLFLALLFVWGLKSFSFRWETGDEAIYTYLSWAALDHGSLPYKDYFFAHPPLQLLWAIPHFALFGFQPVAIKSIPLISLSLTALFLFLIGLKKLGRTGALVTALSFLGAYTLLRSAGFWTGIHESVMWATVGLWLFFEERPLLSAIALALGVGTGTYILPAALLVGSLFWVQDPKKGKKYLLGFLTVWGAIQLLGTYLGGKSYWQSVYAYHFKKPEAKQPAWKDSLLHFFENFPLFWTGICGFVIASVEQLKFLKKGLRPFLFENSKKSVALVGLAWAFGYLIFLHLLNKRFSFYYNLCMPGLALGAGFLAQDLMDYLFLPSQSRVLFLRKNWLYPLFTSVFIVSGLLASSSLFKFYVPGAFRAKDQEMKWLDSPIPLANYFFKWCCWDSVALAGKKYGAAKELLYRQTDSFRAFNKISDYIIEHSSRNDRIFGDSISTGLIALLSKRQIIDDFADTNTMRFTSGVTPPSLAISQIDRPELKFVLVSGRPSQKLSDKKPIIYHRFASRPEFRKWLDGNFRIVLRVPLSSKNYYYLMERNKWR